MELRWPFDQTAGALTVRGGSGGEQLALREGPYTLEPSTPNKFILF